jgi:hypothetical protein
MKKIRMMLPVMAVVFAVGAALASPISAWYQSGTNCLTGTTEQQNCVRSDDMNFPLCTIKVGSAHKPAFQNSDCTGVLRDIKLQ